MNSLETWYSAINCSLDVNLSPSVRVFKHLLMLGHTVVRKTSIHVCTGQTSMIVRFVSAVNVERCGVLDSDRLHECVEVWQTATSLVTRA
jgi:hypothetical protein